MSERRPRVPPALALELEYEDPEPLVRLLAESAEDEERMKAWLRRSSALDAAHDVLDRVAEELRHDDAAGWRQQGEG